MTLLVTRDTASASESVINSLRGVGVTVNLIGAITRGKPHGFVPQNNCERTYFAIQFKDVNNLGFGDYADGFPPTCPVADDFSHMRGELLERRLSTALSYRQNGFCPTVATALSAPRAQALLDGSVHVNVPAFVSREIPALPSLTDRPRP